MALHESGENYLETILVLKERNGRVRSIDIANELEFSKPSVSRAVGILKTEGLIKVDSAGYIELTNEGEKQAEAVYNRHTFISEYLEKALGVSKEIADEDACRFEHVISEESFAKIQEWLEKNA